MSGCARKGNIHLRTILVGAAISAVKTKRISSPSSTVRFAK